jgi:hypothetical protein
MDTRDLILEADALARQKGLNQTRWSNMAGKATNGQTVSRLLKRGDCRLSTMQSLLRPLGYELSITKMEDIP